MDRKIKEEMNELSKIVFKSASRWRKILDNGVQVPEYMTKLIPNPATGKIEEKQFKTGKSFIHRYSLEELKNILISMKPPAPVSAPIDLTGVDTAGVTVKVESAQFEQGMKVRVGDDEATVV